MRIFTDKTLEAFYLSFALKPYNSFSLGLENVSNYTVSWERLWAIYLLNALALAMCPEL